MQGSVTESFNIVSPARVCKLFPGAGCWRRIEKEKKKYLHSNNVTVFCNISLGEHTIAQQQKIKSFVMSKLKVQDKWKSI